MDMGDGAERGTPMRTYAVSESDYYPTTRAFIELDDFSLYYDCKPALTGITVGIPRYSVTTIIGPSGSGKSSFVRALNLLFPRNAEATYRGDIRVGGISIFDPNLDGAEVRRHVGFVFQRPTLLPGTVLQNITYPLRVDGVRDRHALYRTARDVLSQLALERRIGDYLDHQVDELSTPRAQMVSIARAWIRDPAIILLDDPGWCFDPNTTAWFEGVVRSATERATVIMATNDPQQAKRISDYTLLLIDGRIADVKSWRTQTASGS